MSKKGKDQSLQLDLYEAEHQKELLERGHDKVKPWWKTAKEWVCQECGTVNPMASDVCSGCDCSLDSFVDDEWLCKERR